MRLGTQNRLARALAAASVAAIATLGVAAQVGAQNVGTLESRIASARDEAQGIAADIEAKTAALGQARTRAAAAAERENELSGLLAQGRERAAALAERVSEAEARLARTRRHLRRAIGVLEDRLVAIYKDEVPDGMTLLLEADGFEDLVTRTEYLQRIEDADAELVARVQELRAQVEADLAAVSEARDTQQAFNDRLESAEAQIASVRAAAESQAETLANARAAQADSLESLRSNVGEWTEQVEKLQSVSETQAQQQVGSWFGDWAIPAAIVMCESGGNFGALNPSGAGGAYQILPSTWKAYGGQGLPHQASPAEQHRIAAQIWADSGGGAWVCAG
jgi:peptidoglycan hydrolase CwlO-like protein